MADSAHGGNGARNAPAPAPATFGDFAATHRPIFTEARETLEAKHWLRAIESKFGLIHCTEHQKTLFIVQKLWGDASAWWANYTTSSPADYQVPWAEFHNAFRAHHILVGVMRRKCQEFMDLKQEGRSVHDYSKLFNHLVQYVPYQVDTKVKKKNHFMNGLSTKLQERMVLSTRGSFSEYISNVIITDDAIRAHKERKKREPTTAPSGSAPPKYRMVYHHRPAYLPQQH
jgi:hypothetical protein